jgi:hypothetical protein
MSCGTIEIRGESIAERLAAYPMTVTCHSSGRPGTGVQGVGVHTSGAATNGTSTEDVPVPTARRPAVKLVPEALLDVSFNTRPSEMVGGPGQVPPDMSSPPVSTSVEPTVTHTAVTPSDGCHFTLTVPLAHPGVDGVDVPSVAPSVVTVMGVVATGVVDFAEVDEEAQLATERLVATATRARCQIATSAT